MELVMQLTFALTVVNIVLLLALAYVYGRNWAGLRSRFTLGLLVFTLAFLVQYVTSFYFYVTNMDYYVDMVSMHVFILTLLQTVGFAVLNGISWK
jgi:chromate transport protein ChrA